MGDILNAVVLFLEEYYVYVVGAGLIIVLMLIGLLTSKRKARKNAKADEAMANINDISTGSINDVASVIQSNTIQPVDITNLPDETVKPVAADPVAPIATPISNPINVANTGVIDTPINNTIKEEPIKIDNEDFDKTEIIDFSSFNTGKPVEPKVDNFTPFVTDKSQNNGENDILNGEDSHTEGL
ncbi:MAG: hypothetical protein WC343_01785 [Bacilli bacterium]|jgi:hypothetical protein